MCKRSVKKLSVLSITVVIVGCGSGSGQNSNEEESAPIFGAAAPLVSADLDNAGDGLTIGADGFIEQNSVSDVAAADINLTTNVPYEWSVRVRTPIGLGEWSTPLEFSIHDSEALALANAVNNGLDVDFDPALFSDSLPVPTVVSYSPIGSQTDSLPSFRWVPIFDAESYEVRVIEKNSQQVTFIESFVASDLCEGNECRLRSTPGANGEDVVDQPELINVGGSETSEPVTIDPVVVQAPANQPAEVEVVEPAVTEVVNTEQEPADQAVVPETLLAENYQPVIVDAAATQELAVQPSPPPEIVTEPEQPELVDVVDVEVNAPEEMTALSEPELASEPMNSAINQEIEELQRTEGVLAFPGAVGFGKNAVGGRQGQVIVVNTVDDIVNSKDGLMSLREAIEVESGPRTIVFEVGGVFDTGSDLLDLLSEQGSYVTLACQTAPAPGVIIKTYGFNVQNGAHDIIFRHCAVRGIDPGAPLGQAGRGITIRGASYNVILDHMSMSWATDEGFQAYLAKDQTTGLKNITLSNSIVAEGDADSSHPESIDHPNWGYHAMGPSCLNNNTNFRPTNCSLVNNFVAHNSSRNSMIWGGAGELSNNIVYNWYAIGLTARTYFENDVDAIVLNNLMKSGPDTEGATSNGTCGPAKYRCAMALGSSDSHGTARYLARDNYYIDEGKTLADAELIDNPKATTPAGVPAFDAATPSNESILAMAAPGSRHMRCLGASLPERDAVDARVLQEFHDGTGAIGIGDNVRSGGHNVTRQRPWNVYGSSTAHPIGYDVDKDGMSDEWEVNYGLNPADPNDHSGDLDGDGYTNIEEYLAILAVC